MSRPRFYYVLVVAITGLMICLALARPIKGQDPTVTPTPTITSTLGKLITRTPAPAAACPSTVNKLVTFNHSTLAENDISAITTYLNAGGAVDALESEIRQTPFNRSQVTQIDVTGDHVPDIVINLGGSDFGGGTLVVVWCQTGRYMGKILQSTGSQGPEKPHIATIQDLNGDNVADIAYSYIPDVGVHGYGATCVDIFEWQGQGQNFVNLDKLDNRYDLCNIIEGDGSPVFRPHGDGTYEVGLGYTAKKDTYYGGSITERAKQIIWAWNGFAFTRLCSIATEPAIYRVQAVLDGDDQFACEHYDKALLNYQHAIFNNSLLGWTDADSFIIDERDPTATPAIDPNEIPLMAAYARYRIILIHLVQHDLAAAKTDLTILQQTFPVGKVGHAFAELATALIEGYTAQGSLTSGCQKAVVYGTQHQDTVIDPFSNYQFSSRNLGGYPQSAFAFSDDISQLCPFR